MPRRENVYPEKSLVLVLAKCKSGSKIGMPRVPLPKPNEWNLMSSYRRAKLKRFTIDDQESMLKSRALPVGFDTTHALHYMDNPPSQVGTVGSSLFSHPNHHGHDIGRSNTTGRGWPNNAETELISPVSMSTSFGDLYSVPGSLAPGMFSPTSPSSEISQFFTPPMSQGTSLRVQAQIVRSRAASTSAIPMNTTMARMAGLIDPGESYFTGISHQQRPNRCSQQECIRRPSRVDVSMKHGDLQNGLPSNIPGCYPYDPSYFVDLAEYPRRASDSDAADKQNGMPVVTPVRPAQSAPLAVPPEFLQTQQSLSNQLNEAVPPAELAYGQGFQINYFWEPDQIISACQTEHADHLSNEPGFDPSLDRRYDLGDSTRKQETFRG